MDAVLEVKRFGSLPDSQASKLEIYTICRICYPTIKYSTPLGKTCQSRFQKEPGNGLGNGEGMELEQKRRRKSYYWLSTVYTGISWIDSFGEVAIITSMKVQPKSNIKALKKAILDLHGCKATWVKPVPLKETFEGQTVWEGLVQVFDLQGHPTASRCYAWSDRIDDSKKRRFFAVLHEGSVKSAQDAVRAADVNQFRKGEPTK